MLSQSLSSCWKKTPAIKSDSHSPLLTSHLLTTLSTMARNRWKQIVEKLRALKSWKARNAMLCNGGEQKYHAKENISFRAQFLGFFISERAWMFCSCFFSYFTIRIRGNCLFWSCSKQIKKIHGWTERPWESERKLDLKVGRYES